MRIRSEKAKRDEAERVARGREAMALPPGERSAAVRRLIATETQEFLRRREDAVRRLRLDDLRLNPFQLRLVRRFHGLDTPARVVSYLVDGRLHAGEETAYGWLVDLFLPPIFGASTPPEREQQHKWEGFKEIDKEVVRPNPADGIPRRHLVSLKAGPWTINDTMAQRMAANVRELQRYGADPVVYGVTYGRREQLTNKPGIVKGEFPDELVAVLVGREFWDWLAGYKDAHRDIMDGIADGEQAYQSSRGVDLAQVVARKKTALTDELKRQYQIVDDADLWPRLNETAF